MYPGQLVQMCPRHMMVVITAAGAGEKRMMMVRGYLDYLVTSRHAAIEAVRLVLVVLLTV